MCLIRRAPVVSLEVLPVLLLGHAGHATEAAAADARAFVGSQRPRHGRAQPSDEKLRGRGRGRGRGHWLLDQLVRLSAIAVEI